MGRGWGKGLLSGGTGAAPAVPELDRQRRFRDSLPTKGKDLESVDHNRGHRCFGDCERSQYLEAGRVKDVNA